MGGILHRQEDGDEDEVVYRHNADGHEKNIDICHEFDNFVREIFEVEPPLGEFFFLNTIQCFFTFIF